MTTYEALQMLHVIAAIIWLGAGFTVVLLLYGAERARDHEWKFRIYADVAWLSGRLFIPASLSTLVFGVLVVAEGDLGFDQLWITLGLIAWAVSFLLGILYFKPGSEKLGELQADRGPNDPEVVRRSETMNVVERVQLLVLFLAVADMVVKPTGDDSDVLIVGAVILGLATVAAVATITRRRRAAPAS